MNYTRESLDNSEASPTGDRILFYLKTHGPVANGALAEALAITPEAARQQVQKLVAGGLVEGQPVLAVHAQALLFPVAQEQRFQAGVAAESGCQQGSDDQEGRYQQVQQDQSENFGNLHTGRGKGVRGNPGLHAACALFKSGNVAEKHKFK